MRSLYDHAVRFLEHGGQQLHLEDDVGHSINVNAISDVVAVARRRLSAR